MRSIPETADVLVIGAGPAGSACAHMLASAGRRVVLADQHAFPRDKICGDGLIPDAHAALKRLGVYDAVMARAKWVRHVRCIGSRGGLIDVPGSLAVLPRKQLDQILFDNAVAAGAVPLAPARFEAPIVEGGHVVGATLKIDGQSQALRARWTVLATGAVPQPLIAAGLAERHTPSGVALRGYVKNDAMVGRIDKLQIVWHKRLAGGYGWIFPAPAGVFNIGCGITGRHRPKAGGAGLMRPQAGGAGLMRPQTGRAGLMEGINLRRMFEAFCEVHAPAQELVSGGQWVGELKGAPLRCSLDGTRWSRPGMLATGEAAGSTYAFTGEGIGKALETGLLAAESLLAEAADEAARQRYEATLAALRPRFALYEKAQRVNAHPWLADFLIWRAQRSPRLLQRMAGVLEETSNPGHLVTMKGVFRLLTE